VLNQRDTLTAKKNNKVKYCIGGIAFVTILIVIIILTRSKPTTPPLPPTPPTPLESFNQMLKVFEEMPDFDSIGTLVSENGLSLKKDFWENPFIGGPIFNNSNFPQIEKNDQD
jgi:hypothetical protein